MHLCAADHGTLNSLTNKKQSITDVKHSELEKSQISRDCTDLSAMIWWFTSNNPFECSDTSLLCLSYGVVASDTDTLNCDTAESVGEQILLKMDNIGYADIIGVGTGARVGGWLLCLRGRSVTVAPTLKKCYDCRPICELKVST